MSNGDDGTCQEEHCGKHVPPKSQEEEVVGQRSEHSQHGSVDSEMEEAEKRARVELERKQEEELQRVGSEHDDVSQEFSTSELAEEQRKGIEER